MFTVHLSKERFKFSSSHFTLFSESEAERLHGHNYQVEVHIEFKKLSPETGLAAEFQELKHLVDALLQPLDEKILLPSLSPFLHLGEAENNVEVKFAGKFYSFPQQDCQILEIVNTSSECLAQWLFEELKEELKAMGAKSLRVSLFETSGQGVSFADSL